MRKCSGLTLAIVLVVSTMMIFIPSKSVEADGSGPDYPPPAIGDWIIDSDTSVWDETIIVNGSIIVTDTGKLMLVNCTLKMNSASDGQYKIRVDVSGELYIYESLVTPFNTAFKYRFEVYGKLWTNHSTIEYMWGDENGAPYTGGIQIYDAPSKVWLNHTNVWRSGANGIHAMGAVGVNITGCNITDNTRMEVYASNSQYINLTESNFTDYIDARIGHGIWIRHSKYVDISHTYIANHQGDNLRLNNTTYSQVTNCDIGIGDSGINVGSGIGLDYCDSTLRIAWNNISDNLGGGISYVTRSSPIIENNYIANNVYGIGNWGEPKSWDSEFYIYNNTLVFNQNEGMHIRGSNATIINNTLIIDNIEMRNSSALVEDCYIQGSNTFHLWDSSPFIVNSTINCLNDYSFNIHDASHPFTLNCTVDLWDHMYIWDALSNVTVQNYLHVQVIEEDGSTPILDAWVNVTDNGDLVYSGLTDVNGEVRWIPVTNRTYLQDYWNPFHPFENITYNNTVVQVEKGGLVFIDNPRIVGMNSSHWEVFQALFTYPPNINHTPVTSAIIGDIINITANLTDNGSVDSVFLNYTDVDGINYNVSMTKWSGNYSYEIPGQTTIGSVDYFIWANDTDGNDNQTIVYQIKILKPAQTNLTLQYGWNLISFPVEQPKLNGTPIIRASDLVNVTGSVEVAVWNATDQNYSYYLPGFHDPWDPENFLVGEDDAIFVWMDDNATYLIEGYEPGSRNVTLKTGWNMVAYKNTSVGDVGTLWAPQVSAGAYDDICYYDSQTFRHYIYPGTEMQLIPTRGYFIWSDTDTWLTY